MTLLFCITDAKHSAYGTQSWTLNNLSYQKKELILHSPHHIISHGTIIYYKS